MGDRCGHEILVLGKHLEIYGPPKLHLEIIKLHLEKLALMTPEERQLFAKVTHYLTSPVLRVKQEEVQGVLDALGKSF